MDFEQQYADVLQNLEFAIVSVYRREPGLLDYDVDAALEALIARYNAERQQRAPRSIQLSERREQVYNALTKVCEWRLGRTSLEVEEGRVAAVSSGETDSSPPPLSLEEMVACLKRIRKSVKRWNKQGGRQGYLTFVQQYV
jgi:hypothetical protein